MYKEIMIGTIELRRSFGEVQAVDNVSLEVSAGSILGVLGPNGAGKTTVVRILTTLTQPDSGRAWVGGHDVVREATLVRRKIGVTGQDATLDDCLTGRQNLVMTGELSRLRRSSAKARAIQLLEQFQLSDAADRPVKTYSGGMRRRLDLAASLVARPQVLFLDEPTTGLDPASRQRMWKLILNLATEGTTVLLTTQYLDEADFLANRIAVIDHGRLIAEGTPTELKASTGSQFLDIKLVSSYPRAVDVLKRLSIGKINVSDSGRRLVVPAPNQVGLAVAALRMLDEAGAPVEDIAVRQPSLDDVFAVLTGAHETMEPQGALA